MTNKPNYNWLNRTQQISNRKITNKNMKTYIQPTVKVTEIAAVSMVCASENGNLTGILDGTTDAQGSKIRAWEVIGEDEEDLN